MKIQSINFKSTINVELPTAERNYCLFDEKKVDSFRSQKEVALIKLEKTLKTSNDEKEIVETLYTIDRMIDDGVKGVDKMYPSLSRFNNTNSHNIQTFLAGIYRKTLVPDAFGPLMVMLIRNAILLTPKDPNFDANEEIGGAILSYIHSYPKAKSTTTC